MVYKVIVQVSSVGILCWAVSIVMFRDSFVTIVIVSVKPITRDAQSTLVPVIVYYGVV